MSAAWVGYSKKEGISTASCNGDHVESWTTAGSHLYGHVGVPILASDWSDMPVEVFGKSVHACDVELPLFCFEQ